MPSKRARTNPTVGERIGREIELAILSGRLRPGDRLPTEEELVARHGSSRSAVREAVHGLRARGLVISRRGSGSYVAADVGTRPLRESLGHYATLRANERGYTELFDLRLMVERFCVRRLALLGKAADRSRLRAAFERMKMEKGDLTRFGEADIAFHQELVAGAKHELFATILGGLFSDLGRRFAQDSYHRVSQVRQVLLEHEAVVEAVEAGDADLAEGHLVTHLVRSRADFQKSDG
ncbi:MAG: hypothetical protein RLZZ50_2045 [Verrucomicrobiota bacterium]|jgi:GntR family transcriptional repressor for pyruvate dehydrogenase complex